MSHNLDLIHKNTLNRETVSPDIQLIPDLYLVYIQLTLIQLCGVRTDPAATEIVTLLEWKVVDKTPLTQNSLRGLCRPRKTGLRCNFFTIA